MDGIPRCDDCREQQYACPDCEERAYLQAGMDDVNRELNARSRAATRRARAGSR